MSNIDFLYGTSYYDRMHEALEDERVIDDIHQFYSVLDNEFGPEAVLDLGCGIGHFLKPFYDNGKDVHGIDGSQYAVETGVIPREYLEVHDLQEPYETDRYFDLVVCIELLEHLPQSSADTIVNTIASSGQTAVVSAAPPGQGGSYHLNEQPAKYWINKFQNEGMQYREDITISIREGYSPKKIQYRGKDIMVFENK